MLGLTILSEIDLGLPPATDLAMIDVHVEEGHGLLGPAQGDQLVLSSARSEGTWVRAARRADGSLAVEFSDALVCHVDADLRSIVADVRDPDIGPVLIEGWMLAFLLALRGHAILHASAVASPGGPTIAFVGSEGMGKSTVATLLCAEGAALVTDDVARVDLVGDVPHIFRGGTHTRLREKSVEVAELVEGIHHRTSDDRLAVNLDRIDHDRLPLDAILVPVPSRSATSVQIDWLAPMDAVVEIQRHPRLHRWHDLDVRQAQFNAVGEIAGRLPIGRVLVPWGPPWRNGVGRAIAAAVEERLATERPPSNR